MFFFGSMMLGQVIASLSILWAVGTPPTADYPGCAPPASDNLKCTQAC